MDPYLALSCDSPIQKFSNSDIYTMGSGRIYSIQKIPGKGLGIVSEVKILRGMSILSEAPVLLVDRTTECKEETARSLAEDVAALSKVEQLAFLSLHNAFKDEITRNMGIIRTNALPLGPDANTGGVFLESSYLNHACLPNAQHTWNEVPRHLTIHAVRDIEKGEEITISYLNDHPTHAIRRKVLQDMFRFSCSCQLCHLPPPGTDWSDGRPGETI